MRLILAALVACCFAFTASATASGGGGGAPKTEDKPLPGIERAGKRISISPDYIYGPQLSSFVAVRLGAPRAAIAVEFGWEVTDPAVKARMRPMRARLTDAVRAAIADYATTRHRPGGPPNLDQLTALMQQATDGVLGAPGAKIMLANVVVQER